MVHIGFRVPSWPVFMASKKRSSGCVRVSCSFVHLSSCFAAWVFLCALFFIDVCWLINDQMSFQMSYHRCPDY